MQATASSRAGAEGIAGAKAQLIEIASDVEGGIFEIMFCSVDCLRSFLNDCLNTFEERVRKLKPLQRPMEPVAPK